MSICSHIDMCMGKAKDDTKDTRKEIQKICAGANKWPVEIRYCLLIGRKVALHK